MSRLEVVADGRRYSFGTDATVICGRSVEAHVPLTDRRVGRVHARLQHVGGVWHLVDAKSTNGTWIDGERVSDVAVEDELTAFLGNPANGAVLYLRVHETAETPPPAAPAPRTPAQREAAELLTTEAPAVPASPPSWPVRPPAQPAAAQPSVPAQPSMPVQPPVPAGGPVPAQPTAPIAQPAAPVPPPMTPGAPSVPAAPMPGTGFSVPGGPTQAIPYPTAPVLPGVGTPGARSTPTLGGDPYEAVPVLVVRLGTRTLIFPVGQPVRVGREPGLEAVTDHPLVTRNHHGVLTSDTGGATYTDTSTRGTFVNGKQLKAPLRITEPVTLRLGDPATGEELGVTPPLTHDQLRANLRRRERGRRLKIMAGTAAAVLVVAAGVVGAVVVTRGHPTSTNHATSSQLSSATLHLAETATVRLLQGTPDSFTGWGSGTVISPDGLILTNAHVAAPRTPGQAVASATPGVALESNPPFVTVEFTTNDSSAAVPRYRAKVVAADGYLDLAVLRIYATTDGGPVDPTSLKLPYLKLGDVNRLQLDSPVTLLGYPGVSGSDSITVTSGAVSTFIADASHHVTDPRFQLETTARVAHGNSGGAAVDNAGELIGVPSLEIPGQGGDLSWRLRSVTLAAPLIAAAKAGRPYASTLLTPLAGTERVLDVGVGSTPDEACQGGISDPQPGDSMWVVFRVAGIPTGLDVAFAILLPDGTPVTTDDLQHQNVPGLPEAVMTQPQGCIGFDITAASLDRPTLPTGDYQAQLLGGPNLQPLGPVTTLTAGVP